MLQMPTVSSDGLNYDTAIIVNILRLGLYMLKEKKGIIMNMKVTKKTKYFALYDKF